MIQLPFLLQQEIEVLEIIFFRKLTEILFVVKYNSVKGTNFTQEIYSFTQTGIYLVTNLLAPRQ